jgi:ParB family chromosome partitioning protein
MWAAANAPYTCARARVRACARACVRVRTHTRAYACLHVCWESFRLAGGYFQPDYHAFVRLRYLSEIRLTRSERVIISMDTGAVVATGLEVKVSSIMAKQVATVATVATPAFDVATFLANNATRTDLSYDVPFKLIRIETGYNVRAFAPEHDADDAQLLADIGRNGIRTPLDVRIEDGFFYVVAGHRRFGALQLLAAKDARRAERTIPCNVLGGMLDDKAGRVRDIARSNLHKGLTPYQKGLLCLDMKAGGMSDDDIGRELAVTGRAVRDMMRLAQVSPDVVAHIKAGSIGDTLALETVKAEGDNAGAVIAAALKIATGMGKTRVTAPHIAAALKAIGQSGKTAVGSIAKTEASIAKLATPAAMKAGVPVASPVVTSKPVAAVAPVAPVKPVAGKAVTLVGPFRVSSDDVLDRDGETVCTAYSVEAAQAVCALMNAGYPRMSAASGPVAKIGPNGQPAKIAR